MVLRRHISVLFQDVGEFSGLTIAENIGLGCVDNIESSPAIRRSATDSGAAEFIEQFPHRYDSYLGRTPGWWSDTEGYGKWEDFDSDSDSDDEEQKTKVVHDLSGGQWQKLGLARAFMRESDADLMVLDEPTAKLDPEAEVNLFENIRRTRKGRTTIYISHRFNTVKFADAIMVMENGDVKEFGTHEELMGITDGRYRKLYSLQAKGFQIEDKIEGH
jgi:ATP-binding cassette, subfamily B, bacterial